MALRWCGITGAEHSAALLAWARESGQQERKLRKWLEEREIPPVMHTYAEEVARKHSAQFAPGQTVTT